MHSMLKIKLAVDLVVLPLLRVGRVLTSWRRMEQWDVTLFAVGSSVKQQSAVYV